MKHEIDPTVDFAFKLLFGSKDDLPVQLRTPAIIRAMEVLMRTKETQEDSEAYRQRILKKVESMYKNLPEEQLIEMGKEEGLIVGEVKRIHLAQRVLKLPQTPRNELLWRSLGQLTELGDQLEAQIPTE